MLTQIVQTVSIVGIVDEAQGASQAQMILLPALHNISS
jgi:hypothetical protein